MASAKLLSEYYKPLNSQSREIRVLSILPSSDAASEIFCQLKTQSLEKHPTYDALSYCWGAEAESPVIYLSGEKLAVRPNLFAALRQLRDKSKTIQLWVDAICINQSDNKEKESQVSMMGLVYQHAKIVYAWLGEEADGSAEAMGLLQNLQTVISKGSVDQLHILKSQSFVSGWVTLIPFLRRAYWTRAWIVQEVLLAENVMICCGKHQVAWPIFCILVSQLVPDWSLEALGSSDEDNLILSALQKLRYLTQDVGHFFHLTLKYQKQLSARGPDRESTAGLLDLLDCLTMTRWRLATDERDHVYSILSLADITSLQPNYRDTPVWLFREVVIRDIEARGRLDVLSGCKHFSEGERNFTEFSKHAIGDLDQNVLLSRELASHGSLLSSRSPREAMDIGQHPVWYEKSSGCLESWYKALIEMAEDVGIEHGPDQPRVKFGEQYSFEVLSSLLADMRKHGQQHNSCEASDRVREFEGFLHRFLRCHRQRVLGRVLNASLPTWAPNWTLPIMSPYQNILLNDGSRDRYCSAGSTVPRVSFDKEGKRMTFKAVLLDKVAYTPGAIADDPLKGYWHCCSNVDIPRGCPYEGTIGRMEAFRQLLSLGRETLSLCTLRWVILGMPPDRHREQEIITEAEMRKEIASVYQNCVGEASRQFFITQSGYFGAGPTTIMADDIVVIPFGSNVPFILRQNDDFFYLIEECYVQGFMNGAIFEEADYCGRDCREFCVI